MLCANHLPAAGFGKGTCKNISKKRYIFFEAKALLKSIHDKRLDTKVTFSKLMVHGVPVAPDAHGRVRVSDALCIGAQGVNLDDV